MHLLLLLGLIATAVTPAIAASSSTVAPANAATPAVSRAVFGHTPDGVEVSSYTLVNRGGSRATILTFGAILADLRVPDAFGHFTGVVREIKASETGFTRGFAQSGAVFGRVANRTSNARFSLEGVTYTLAANDGPNHLHGGRVGFNRRVWSSAVPDETKPSVVLTLVSPDGDEGYPGTVTVRVTYTLTDDHTLRIAYDATTDRATPLNLTNHAFFNLRGSGDVLDHEVEIAADRVAETSERLIPTGKLLPVRGTAADFTQPMRLGARADQLGPRGRYDHPFVLGDGMSKDLRFAARVTEPQSGRRMEVWTTEPSVQLYTSLLGATSDANRFGFFCLETQHLPDSVNRPEFPSIILRPGQTFRSVTEYRFSALPVAAGR